ncbi:MAG: GNAT family N-acetyltransferase [Kiloniellaceae bacterium]
MSETVTVRRARPGDAAGIARVHVETWRNAYPGVVPKEFLVGMTEARQAAQWEAALRRCAGPEAVLVAEAVGPSGPQLVGFGSCGRARVGPYAGEVYTLYVGHDWQGRGIGRRLLAGLFGILVEAGLNGALVWVLSANPARFFYETMGGRRVAERREPFAGVLLDETAYGWPDLAAWLAARGSRS